jgi:hypothetical protein
LGGRKHRGLKGGNNGVFGGDFSIFFCILQNPFYFCPH